VRVGCGECGSGFMLSARTVRGARMRGLEPVCWDCRHPPKPPETLRYWGWWLASYSLAELVELGRGLDR